MQEVNENTKIVQLFRLFLHSHDCTGMIMYRAKYKSSVWVHTAKDSILLTEHINIANCPPQQQEAAQQATVPGTHSGKL